MKGSFLFRLFFCCCLIPPAFAGQSIAEKKESFSHSDSGISKETRDLLRHINSLLEEKHLLIKHLYEEALYLYQTDAEQEKYIQLLDEIKIIKAEIVEIQQMWRKQAADYMQNDEYALWHQPETTMSQLVMDYGSSEYIYLVPPEVGTIRFSLNSNLPIPRESWGDCLELILGQHGVGVRQLNPYLRELYILRNDPSGIKAIISAPEEIDFYSPQSQICFVLSPNATDPRGDLLFLQKFSNPNTTKVEIIGGKIFISASAEIVQELLKLYTFAQKGTGGQDFQLITLSKIDASEMETILNTAFHDGKAASEGSTLRVIPLKNLSQSLFLSGNKEEVKKAISLVRDIEAQVEDPQEKTVFWYTTKHSEAEELASVLAKVYDLLIEGGAVQSKKEPIRSGGKVDDKLIVSNAHVKSGAGQRTAHKTADGRNNFVVDPKTGSIIMVVEQDSLSKIKELLKKLDVPKKMVQLEVLLFEKKVSDKNRVGLNLFKLGADAGKVAASAASTGLSWTAAGGILEFLSSHSKGSGIPAYDIAYQFMLSQEDVQINASPSVTTMNQTPATIAVVEEVSVDAGADKDKNRIYQRAQYGIIIQITPTINVDEHSEAEEGNRFVTLETDITFDTPKKNPNDRPDVTRRHIKNHVRIADGQTVILGGLRSKSMQDNKESIPFLGEIPGIGKLFSHTAMDDRSTEMFVFITPKIIADPIEDAERVRREELNKRPGDIPEFLHELVHAKERQKKRLFESSLTALFGRQGSRLACRQEEYDGR